MLPIPEGVEISTVLIESEKIKQPIKLLKKVKKEGGSAFHEKSDKNKKVNLGGPGKTKPRKTKPRNRAVERNRDKKRKALENSRPLTTGQCLTIQSCPTDYTLYGSKSALYL